MARRITVTPEQLNVAAAKIESLAMSYQKTYVRLYTEIANMRSAWDGADNIAYTAQVNGFEDDFQKMYQLMRDYASFVRKSASSYQRTQDSIINSAHGLGTNVVNSPSSAENPMFVKAEIHIMPLVGPGGQFDREAFLQESIRKIGENLNKDKFD